MIEATVRTYDCSHCRFWAPNLRAEVALEGVCRKLVENPRYFGSLVTEARDKCDQWARLGSFEDGSGEIQQDRRATLRNRINLPARLRTTSTSMAVWLADISELGAGIGMRDPPPVGMPVVLKWSCYEVFASVVWSNDDSCGLMFDAPVSSEVVLEAMREGALKNDRSAETSRIVMGRKRGGSLRASTYDSP